MAKHIDVTHIDGLPFTSLSVDFMEECANCPVIDVKAEVSPGSLALTCYNAQACRAIISGISSVPSKPWGQALF